MLIAGFPGRLNLDEGAGVEDTLTSGIGGDVTVFLTVGAGGVGEILISGTGGGVTVFLTASSIALMVGTTGDVTALDSGRGVTSFDFAALAGGCVDP